LPSRDDSAVTVVIEARCYSAVEFALSA